MGRGWDHLALFPVRVRDPDIKATKYQMRASSSRCLQPPAPSFLSFPWHTFPGATPGQESAGTRWCLGGLGSARGSPHTILPLASLPPALSRHTYLSCRIRLGLLPSEPDKEATGQGRDGDKDAEQEWHKDGGDRAQGRRCGAQRKKSLVENLSSLTTGSLVTATTCIRGILQPLGQQPCLAPPSPRWARILKAERMT